MTDPTITCPNCKTEIKLTESLAAPIIATIRRDYDQKLAQKDIDNDEKVRQERSKIAIEEAKKARAALGTDLDQRTKEVLDLQNVLAQREAKLAEAQKVQADVLRQQRELTDAKREMDLTIEKRIQESIGVARDQARKEAEESLKFKVMEKEETISSMQRQIEDLKRRAEQGSQQLQGEVLELRMEELLRARFPIDVIEPVAKGVHGGDVLQRVVNPAGQPCGTIIWEFKRTKSWSDSWLAKLRGDQREAKADVAVIVSQILPKGIETFDFVEGVWITQPQIALAVSSLLRQGLIEVAGARQASEGQQTKMGMVYQYMTGPRFRQRVQAIVEAFSTMQDDLKREKMVITKQWAKREEQAERMMQSTVGMYGDLQSIAGKTLQEIDGLEALPLERIQ